MKCYVTRNGQPVLEDVSEPLPNGNEALIRVSATSLNRGELSLLGQRRDGWRPGQDVAGVVVRSAADGAGPKEGSRIVGLVDQASWSELVTVPHVRLSALPDGVGLAEAATLPVAGLTALRLVRLGGDLLGRRVLITGASGAVGNVAVQLARLAGAQITAVTGDHSAELLRGLGATDAIPTVDDAVGRFDLVLESVGGPSLEAVMKKVAAKGTIVTFGNSSGKTASFDLFDFASGGEGARLKTFFSYSVDGERTGEDLFTLATLIDRQLLNPLIDRTVDWRELASCLQAMKDRQVHGKIVMTLNAALN